MSFCRYLPWSLQVVEKQNKCEIFLPPFFPEGWPQLFYGTFLARFTVHHLAKFGWLPFTGVHLQSLAMKWNAEFTEGGWKLTSSLKPFVDQKFMSFWDDVGDPLRFVMQLPDYVYHISCRRHRPLKLPSSCEVVEKGWFWSPDFYGEGIPQISDMFLKIALTSQHMASFAWVSFNELGEYCWRKNKKIEENIEEEAK